MKKSTIIIATFLFLNSCKTECDCIRDLGCRTITIIQKSNNSIIADTTFCSKTHFSSDTTLKIIGQAFTKKYYYPPYDQFEFKLKDSIFERKKVDGMTSWKEIEPFEKQGYRCQCLK